MPIPGPVYLVTTRLTARPEVYCFLISGTTPTVGQSLYRAVRKQPKIVDMQGHRGLVVVPVHERPVRVACIPRGDNNNNDDRYDG